MKKNFGNKFMDDIAQPHPFQRGTPSKKMSATEATFLATYRPNYINLIGGGYMSNIVEIQGRKYVLVPLESIAPAPSPRNPPKTKGRARVDRR